MAKIIHKKSSVVGKIPAVGDLDFGELALNYADGKLFYKASNNSIQSFGGAALSNSVRQQYTATAGQTTFNITYTPGYIDVYLNGVKLLVGTDFTATNGTSVVLATGAAVGDIVDIVAGTIFASADWQYVTNKPTTISGFGITDAQPLDADLTAISAVSGNTGFLRKIAADTWQLDTNTYLTGNQNIVLSGDVSGNGTTGISVTLANSGVVAGTYSKVMVDAKGRVTAGYSLQSSDLPTYTGTLSSSQVTTALGFTPYNSTNPSGYISGNQTITFSGDATGSGATSVALTLANSGVTAGTYGSSTAVPVVTVDAKGRVTSVSTQSISGSLAFTGDVTGTGATGSSTALTLSNSGVTAGTYTKVTVDAKGRATSGTTLSASDIPSLDASKITSGVIDAARLPSYVDDVLEFANLAALPTTGETGKIYLALDTNKAYRWSGSAYVYITSGAVDSVAGKTGVVTLTNADVGLANVENKSSATIRGELTSANVTSALGFTPYNSTNPSGYITSSALTPYLTAATASSTYLPLTGGNLTDALSITGGSANATYTSTQTKFADGSIHAMKTVPGGVFEAIRAMNLDTTVGTTVRLVAAATSDAFNNTNGGKVFIDAVRSATNNMDLVFSLNDIPGGAPLEKFRFYGGGAFNAVGAITQNGNQVLHAGNFSSYALPLSGGTLTGRVTFPTATASQPQMPNGFLGLDTGDANFDIWGISRDFYPSHPTAANAWGIRWDGDSNQVRFIGNGTTRLAIDLDGGSTGALLWENNTVLHAGNYTNYSPSLTGSGASGLWTISVTGTSRYLGHQDGPRDLSDRSPTWASRSAVFDFVNAGTTGTGGNYAGVLTIVPWTGTTASTGDASYQLAFGSTAANSGGNPQLRIRKGIDSTWNSWIDLLTSANYNSYAPTLTGTGASGTWGINITGSAGSVNASTSTGIQSSFSTTINTTTPGTGFYGLNFSGGGTPDNASGITWAWSSSGAQAGIYVQSSGSYGTKMYLATTDSFASGAKTAVSIDHSGNVNIARGALTQGGNAVLHAGNYTSYSPSLIGSGASGTWSISVTGNAATATRTSSVSGYGHAGTGMHPFYNWGGSDGGGSAPSGSSYTIGISVGSNPGDPAYGFQIARNMWNTGLWTRGYDSSWGSWVRLLDSSNYSSYALPLSGGTLTGNVTYINLYSATSSSYGIQNTNAYFDTVNSGADGDPLELVYVRGSSVKIGTGTYGSKPLYAAGIYDSGNQVLHAGNYSSYALPLNGGTMSGAIFMQGTQRVTNAGFAGIEYWNNSAWQVYIGSENNAGGARFNSANGVHTWYNNSTQAMQLSGSNLNIVGTLTAATKSFLIPHPTKPGMKLQYGSLEGPENGVYVRGKLVGSNTIHLPDYWLKLVDPDTITVTLTPVGKPQNLWVASIDNNMVVIEGNTDISCHYVVYAERVDVAKLKVEFYD